MGAEAARCGGTMETTARRHWSSCRNFDRKTLASQRHRSKIRVEVNSMFLGRITRLTFALLLLTALAAGLGMSNARPSGPTAQATLFVGATPSDCDHCDGCDRPCVVQAVCSHPCVPFGLLTADARTAIHHADRRIPEPTCHLASVAPRVPFPPPRLSHFV
jgi:hypothetical protein